MSKERELLQAIILKIDGLEGFGLMHIIKECKELLAQPEQTEQEPEAWIVVNKETGYRTQVSDLTPFLYNREIFEVIPLYTAPPKREPLSDEHLQQLCERERFTYSISQQLFNAVARRIEKEYGIGGEE